MNFENLYDEFKWKQSHSKLAERDDLQRIHLLARENKPNAVSKQILFNKMIEVLNRYSDIEPISLETSIPIMRTVGILQVINSVETVKQQLSERTHEHSRLKAEAKFIYYFWQMIDEEEVQCREIKELIQILLTQSKQEIRQQLEEVYGRRESVNEFMESWASLCMSQQYYKYQCRDENTSTNQYEVFNGSKNSNVASPIYQRESKRWPLADTTNFMINQFGYDCQLSVEQEKDLISRLYRDDIYKHREELKKEKDSEREKEQLKECTFQPALYTRGRSASQAKKPAQIKGYNKAISRLKAGNQKKKAADEMRQYKPSGQNYERLKQKGINPPKFLTRQKKEEEKVLFIISFDLGRHKTNVKIKEGDTEEMVASKLCKIYSLKQEYYDEICQIVRSQLEAYYSEIEEAEPSKAQV